MKGAKVTSIPQVEARRRDTLFEPIDGLEEPILENEMEDRNLGPTYNIVQSYTNNRASQHTAELSSSRYRYGGMYIKRVESGHLSIVG